ncbi:Uncharacterized protein DBV15_13016, partial [Temnothorax longispinosus]
RLPRVSSCGASRGAAVSTTLGSVATPRVRFSARVPFTKSAPPERVSFCHFSLVLSLYLSFAQRSRFHLGQRCECTSSERTLYAPSIHRAQALRHRSGIARHRMSGSSTSPDEIITFVEGP